MTMDSERKAKLWRRTRVGGGLVFALVALLWLASLDFGPRFVAAFATLAAGLGAWEARRMGLPWKGTPLALLVLAVIGAQGAWLLGWDPALALETLGSSSGQRYAITLAASVALPLLVVGAWRLLARTPADPSDGPSSTARWWCLLWLCVPLACLYPVRLFGGVQALIALVVLSKVGDIAGYYVGSLMGKTKPFPKLSPGKTTAGCVGSLVAGMLAGIGCLWGGLLPVLEGSLLGTLGWDWLVGALVGATINLAAQAGDLYESFWKRQTGVKDSGTWFGPSGGVLDLVDSLLWSAPLAALTWPVGFGWLGSGAGLG